MKNDKTLLRPCPICNGKIGEVLHAHKLTLPKEHPLTNEFDVVCCANCGFVFNDSPSVQQDYDCHYANNSIYESVNLKGLGGTNDSTKFLRIFEQIKPFLSENSSIIDVGCAQGGMFNVLKDNGYFRLHGMDLSDVNLNALQKQGVTPWNNSICSVSNVSQKFDFVILSHILEHVCDLQTSVCNLKKMLPDNGYAYIEVPNANKYAEYYPDAPFHFFNIEHINHFDLNSLADLFEPHNLKIVQSFETSMIVDASVEYPIVGVILQNVNLPVSDYKFSLQSCRDNVKIYIQRCEDDMVRVNQLFSDVQKNGNTVVVWGAGNYAQWLMKNSLLAACNIKCFVDKAVAKHHTFVEGVEVKPVEILLENELNNERTTIVITAAVYKQQIIDEIKNMNLKCLYFVV